VLLAKLKSTADAQPLLMPSALDDIKRFRSNAAGTRVFLGDFTQLLIGMRTSFRVEVSRTGAGAFERLQIAVRSYVRADVALAHPNAFVVLTPA
jgi:HK97 family phage major capsid protein